MLSRDSMVKKSAAVLAVCLAAILPYLSTLHAYFLGDDIAYVQLFSKKTQLHFLSMFTASWAEDLRGVVMDEIRPILALSYQVGTLWGAASPVAQHDQHRIPRS